MALQVNYAALDRLLHRIAFSNSVVQQVASDIENSVFRDSYATVQAGRPIFITSLPRAGTTLLLEVLSQFPSLGTHTYRDMPFVMAPLLWSRISTAFRKRAELNERAHQDGMQVGFDSPEAFEEVLWRTFWPEKYAETGIRLWDAADGKPEAQAHFVEHMKKIIALRRPERKRDGRYLSKNNNNIARLGLLRRMFPDAKILVPVRKPLSHAASLLRQHRNFLAMHKAEPFVRRYMADLGHYEFGELHRPIGFPGLERLIAGRHPTSIDYWLAYWVAAFEHVLTHRGDVTLISYEAACADGRRAVADLSAQLDVAEEGMLETAADLFKAPSAQQSDETGIEPALHQRAEALHRALTTPAS